MNCELARELKDAQFPFKQNTRGETIDIDGRMYCLPTLAELIEACGSSFSGLDRDENANTREVYWVGKSWLLNRNTHGSTPEEAVARLWLALKNKSKAE